MLKCYTAIVTIPIMFVCEEKLSRLEKELLVEKYTSELIAHIGLTSEDVSIIQSDSVLDGWNGLVFSEPNVELTAEEALELNKQNKEWYTK